MKKIILVGVCLLGFNQSALANKAEILNCVDKTTMEVKERCMVNAIEKHTLHNNFFNQLADKKVVAEKPAMATITYYPEKQLIVVKSLEERTNALLASVNH